jgi:hypothetical protein
VARLNLSVCVFVLAVALLLSGCQCKETMLIEKFESKNDRILFRILQETNYLLKSSKKIGENTYNCYSIIKNHLKGNELATYQPINHSISVYEAEILAAEFEDMQATGVEESPLSTLYYQLDKILDIVKGKCLYFRTVTFLTEYCHKLHVRQFDDDFTKFYNQKPTYEDFNLGLFSEERRAVYLKNKLTADLAPKLTDNYDEFKHPYVEMLNHYQNKNSRL